jgi:hypothetical protein
MTPVRPEGKVGGGTTALVGRWQSLTYLGRLRLAKLIGHVVSCLKPTAGFHGSLQLLAAMFKDSAILLRGV